MWHIAPWAFGAVAAWIWLYGFLRWFKSRGWRRTTGVVTRPDGTVPENPTIFDRSGGTRNGSLTFTYTDDMGVSHISASTVNTGNGMRLGKKVTVRFDPERPDKAIIDSFVQSGMVLTFLAVPFALVFVILLTIQFG
jgi:hypothetical protein